MQTAATSGEMISGQNGVSVQLGEIIRNSGKQEASTEALRITSLSLTLIPSPSGRGNPIAATVLPELWLMREM
jgi:hypothetical protein